MKHLTICVFALAGMAGCQRMPAVPIEPVPDFCALTETREFSQIEFDWRLENAPGNLRRDIVQNETRKAECEE